MEILPLAERVWLIPGAVNMGLVATDDGLVAIDTGLDKRAGKLVLNAAQQLGQPLCAIINTHAHADHFGGNRTILQAVSATVHAPVGEAAVIRRPRYEPEYLWQGAEPLPDLRNKFLLAEPSPVHSEFEPGSTLVIGGTEFATIPLPGHAHGQVGILANGVLFAADSYFDRAVVDKHGLPYMVAYRPTIDSAQRVLTAAADVFVPGHGEAATDPGPAVQHLLARHQAAYERVQRVTGSGLTLDEVVAAMCREFDLAPANAGAWALIRTTVAAYLAAAVEDGVIHTEISTGRLVFAAHN